MHVIFLLMLSNRSRNQSATGEQTSPNDIIMASLQDSADSGKYASGAEPQEEDESRVQIQICEDGTIRVVSDRETTV